MIKIFKNILINSLGFLVVFSTLSFSVNRHYCGELLIDSAIFQKTKSCCFENSIDSENEKLQANNTCCTDNQVLIEGQNELKNSFPSFLSFPSFPVIAYPSEFNLILVLNFEDVESSMPITHPLPALKNRLYIFFDTLLI
ncbi:hypothetical protein [Zunongwangia sp. H14]|uniref:HYC_CC_PP family protein n=1 Tax=Zunongwangia sp. H14 TaxID=3240792 RepID=UPI00356683BD